ncbi:plexin domain-containing 2 [Brachionus plicatilis]|uniref:Plexin domain-containing 2 n=1 Tax=Brachionus plicatilis TaxID=10195 RepID=A0A3M7T011_BRAPC|nr:plexin domain-containing 2 [Brachionus plicatilis]
MTTTANNAFTRHPYKNNSEQTIMEDNKNYYHQTVVRAELDQIINWVNLDSSKFSIYDVKKDHDLSNNYLKATIVRLKFRFPYYGHLLDQIVVATGGFLYVGSLMNPLITKAQYIAPLMANFDPALSNTSMIKYVDNTTHFICTWENLRLQDQPDYGEYTFQVIINHDAKIEYTIVQYHVVNIPLENVKTGNSILLFMLPNCLQLKTCDTCINSLTNFNCIWCPELQRCSDTVDRYRQEWLEFGCPMNYESQSNLTCFNAVREASDQKSFKEESAITIKDSDYAKSVSVGVFLTVFLSMIFTTLIWVGYAYKNPNSTSGLWLIEHRPRKLFGLWTTRFNRNTSSLTRLEENTP